MKILYVAMKYDYGRPERGYSFEHYNFYDSLVKMDGGRHEIVYFPFDEIMKESGRGGMNEKLLEAARAEKPDLCFFSLFTDEIKKATIKKISRETGVPTFNWFSDDHWRFYNFSKYYAPAFSWISTTDSRAPEKYEKTGYENVIKTQWACNHFLYKPVESETGYGVTFVGQPHSDRREIVEKIRSAGVEVDCFGTGWPNGHVSQNKMIGIFSSSRINLNLTKASGIIGAKPLAKIFLNKRADGSYRLHNPLYWIDNFRSLWNKRREQIKGRNFEVPGCGGFLLTAGADNLEDYYEDGREIVIFRDTADMIDKIKYYLAHDEERKKIAHAGYERTVREHTYEKRFNKIFETIGLTGRRR